jgi:hypothetical protein
MGRCTSAGQRERSEGFYPPGRTPSVEGRPSFSRRWAREPGPRSGKLRSVASEVSRISPTVFMPAALSALRIPVENRTLSMRVASGSSGAGLEHRSRRLLPPQTFFPQALPVFMKCFLIILMVSNRLLCLARSERFPLSERQTRIGALLVAGHFPFTFSPASRLFRTVFRVRTADTVLLSFSAIAGAFLCRLRALLAVDRLPRASKAGQQGEVRSFLHLSPISTRRRIASGQARPSCLTIKVPNGLASRREV